MTGMRKGVAAGVLVAATAMAMMCCAGVAQADSVKYVPYFNNTVWMGDIHLNVLATDYTSRMEGVSTSRGSYCEVSQESTNYGTRSKANEKCFAQVSQMAAIASQYDYAAYRTL